MTVGQLVSQSINQSINQSGDGTMSKTTDLLQAWTIKRVVKIGCGAYNQILQRGKLKMRFLSGDL